MGGNICKGRRYRVGPVLRRASLKNRFDSRTCAIGKQCDKRSRVRYGGQANVMVKTGFKLS
jgi:hypothetical protein